MHLHTRNVNSAFRYFVDLFNEPPAGRKDEECVPITRKGSRNGAVLMIEEPVTVTYSHPTERVLFNSIRDANPWFHLYESLWMLAGRNDVAPLAYYASRFKEFSDDGTTLNGAYGYRWRHSGYGCQYDEFHNQNEVDQLDILVNHLRADPNSRRAVLSMWNAEDDLLKVSSSRDVCCNLNVVFSLREKDEIKLVGGLPYMNNYLLDMTVTNRSNDLLWGMLGANYVHFTILQEYMAARLGVQVGKYHHITNNLHVYCDRPDWKPEELLDEYVETDGNGFSPLYLGYPYNHFQLVKDPAVFEEELPKFVQMHSSLEAWKLGCKNMRGYDYPTEPFLRDVADPILKAWHWRKMRDSGDGTIEDCLANIQADDWRLAATEWVKRRKVVVK